MKAETMLEELSDHIMDIAMNSVRAGAKQLRFRLSRDGAKDRLTITRSWTTGQEWRKRWSKNVSRSILFDEGRRRRSAWGSLS